MKTPFTITLVMAAAVLIPTFAGATSLSGKGSFSDQSANPPPTPPPLTKRDVVKKYVKSCGKKKAKEANCDKIRKDVIEIVKESLHTLGSSAKRTYVPIIVKFFKSDEVVLRIAAADALGMIGPQDQDADLLALLANDPVPDVRMAVGQAISRGKSPALNLLGQRLLSIQTGNMPDSPPDAGKLPLPVLPQSTYLYYASDAALGRVAYVVKDLNEATAFYKGKAKKGPFKFEEFQEKYRYQLADEDRAKSKADDAESAKQQANFKPDPANMQATMENIQKMNAMTLKRTRVSLDDAYQPKLFDKPTFYILEERQIGQRSYPTRYVVLYQDVALKRPGYRLSWMTLSDDAIKTAQADSLKDEQQEEEGKKRQEAMEGLVKKKGDQEKKNFKKGQADLEKELGF